MAPGNNARIAVPIGILILVWLAAVGLVPFVSAMPEGQTTPAVVPPTPTSAAPPPSTGGTTEEQTYVIEAGDTLWSIATKFYGNGSKYPAILRANNMTEGTRLQIGATLVIPALADATSGASPKISPTPSQAPSRPSPIRSQTPSTGLVATPMAVPSSTPGVEVAPPILEPPKDASTLPFLTVLGLLINILSAICLLGSMTCAFLSIDAYRHSRRYIQKDYIRKRIRVKA